jgi:hypothetical protein
MFYQSLKMVTLGLEHALYVIVIHQAERIAAARGRAMEN